MAHRSKVTSENGAVLFWITPIKVWEITGENPSETLTVWPSFFDFDSNTPPNPGRALHDLEGRVLRGNAVAPADPGVPRGWQVQFGLESGRPFICRSGLWIVQSISPLNLTYAAPGTLGRAIITVEFEELEPKNGSILYEDGEEDTILEGERGEPRLRR